MYRERIGQEVLAAQAASASMTAPTPSTFRPPPMPPTFMPSPTSVEPVPTMEVPSVLADDEDIV
jgi:hypothetical protein